MPDDVLITCRASAPRRIFAVATLASLGILLLYLAIARPPAELALQAFLVLFGLLVLYMTEQLRRATLTGLELTMTELRTTTGEVIAETAEIASVDRGVFAYKPSNGFLVRLTGKRPARWEPGMWWRTGRRVGVGGVVSAPQAKAMAEVLSAMLAEQDIR